MSLNKISHMGFTILLCLVELFYGLLVDSVMLRDTLYANIGETVELRCPYTSHDLQSQWQGPPNLTVLSYGKEIKTSLGNYERLELYGNHEDGELNLKIKNFTRTDEGYYRCISNVNGIAVQSDLQVYIRNKPVLVPNKTLLQLKTEILKPVSVSLTVKSFEKPVVLWMTSCGGKLSTWFVRKTHNKGKLLAYTYLLNSTVIPIEHTDFGSCSVRIRNSEGSTEVSLYLMYEGPPIIAHRKMSLINGRVVLSIYVFSDPRITDTIWIREIFGKTTDNGSERSSMESIRNATVTILSYGVRVSVQGQLVEFNIVELNVTKGRYVCQMRNEHGLKEASFNIVEIVSLLDSYKRPAIRNITGVFALTTIKSTGKDKAFPLTSEQLYILGSIGGFAVITVGLMISICCVWRHHRHHTSYITPIDAVLPEPVIPAQPITVELNVIENTGDTIYEEINSNGHLPETGETDFRSESSFSDVNESDLKDESKYEDIDDLRRDIHEYLECATDSISVVQSEKSLPPSDGYIIPTPEYLDLEEKSSDIPTETLYQNE